MALYFLYFKEPAGRGPGEDLIKKYETYASCSFVAVKKTEELTISDFEEVNKDNAKIKSARENTNFFFFITKSKFEEPIYKCSSCWPAGYLGVTVLSLLHTSKFENVISKTYPPPSISNILEGQVSDASEIRIELLKL